MHTISLASIRRSRKLSLLPSSVLLLLEVEFLEFGLT